MSILFLDPILELKHVFQHIQAFVIYLDIVAVSQIQELKINMLHSYTIKGVYERKQIYAFN